MTGRPLFLPLLGMVAGLCAAHHFSLVLSPWLPGALLAASLVALFCRSPLPFAALLLLLFFAWGALSLRPFLTPDLPPHHAARQVSPGPVIIEGVIDGRPEADGPGWRLSLRAERIVREGNTVPVTGRILVFVKEGRGAVLTGDRIRFAARLRTPENFGLPGEFDYRRYLAYRLVFVTASVSRADGIVLMREGVAFPVRRWFDRLAADLGGFIGERFPAEGGVLRAMLTGERGYVSDATEDAYARAGVNHVLSISGFHVGVIALVLFQLLFRLLALSERLALRLNLRRVCLLATLPPVVFYLLVSGAAPATVRSVIMIAAFTLSLVLERETDPINTLMLTALAILTVAPQDLFDLSFQLSFLALWGLVVLTPLLMHPFRAMGEGHLKKLLLFLAASTAATAATLLPVAHTFHRASVAGIAANLLVVPLLGYGAVIAGFAALPLIHLASWAAVPLLALAAWFVTVSDAIIAVMARIPPLPLRSVSLAELLVFHLALVSVTFLAGVRARAVVCGGAAALLLFLHLPASAGGSGRLTVTFLSVGQGEATLVTLPDGKRMLVDGGGSLHDGGMDVGERLLLPALWSLGVDRIDYLVLTHPHPDHLKGLLAVASTFPVGEFWETGASSGCREYETLKGILAARGVPVRRVDGASGLLAVGGASVEPLAPAGAAGGKGGDPNDDSLVFRLVHGRSSFLFTGDIGLPAEERLLVDPARLRCTVLKVPHHGSRHSSSARFLDAASPRLALISAGKRNSFGLPSPDTLDRLGERGVRVFRTDLDGTIEVVSDGKDEEVRTFAQGHFH